jgi:signal transduction histidine kinase
VRLARLPLAVSISIEDDGVGFDPVETERPERRHGLGLIGIRERAARLNGTVRLESAPGAGTRLIVELPTVARALAASDEQPEQRPAQAPAIQVAVDG